MKDTFGLFVDFLRENREKIKNDLEMSRDSWRRKLYDRVFTENYLPKPESTPVRAKVSSTDSTEFIRELYNGKKLILIRAYTVIGRRIYTSFIPRVISVSRDDLQRFTIMLMEHSEHLSIIEMLKEEDPDYILVDGSLGGRLFRKFKHLEVEGFNDFNREYLSVLGRMLEMSSEKGVPVIFMAKSSETSVFRRYLITLLKREKADAKLIDDEEKILSNDHFLVKSLATSEGYTAPLLQPVKKMWANGEEMFPLLTSHIVPRLNDLPLKVDVFMSMKDPVPGTIERGSFREDILNLMYWGYGDLKTYNIWLADVDRLVKFHSKEVENIYMKAFEKEIGINFYETRGERRARLRI